MNIDSKMKKLEQIVAEIKKLERDLFLELQKKQEEYCYVIKGKKFSSKKKPGDTTRHWPRGHASI